MTGGKIYEEDLIINNIIPLFNASDNLILLDVGAHIGSHSVIYSKSFPNSRILAFEPQSNIFNILNQNINQNNIKNCSSYNNAIGHTNMDTTMSKYLYDGYDCEIEYNVNKTFNYGGIGLGKNGEFVKMISIDSLDIDRCDYIKIDVEGAEILVLTGAVNTINKYHPIIFFEETDKTLSTEMIESMPVCEEKITFEFSSQGITEFVARFGEVLTDFIHQTIAYYLDTHSTQIKSVDLDAFVIDFSIGGIDAPDYVVSDNEGIYL